MKVCKYCGSENDNSNRYCTSCGSDSFFFKCQNCGSSFDSQFCPNCGINRDARKKSCPKCGTKYFSRACPDCGYIPGVNNTAPAPTRQAPVQQVIVNQAAQINQTVTRSTGNVKCCDKTVSLLLCLFLGIVGAHKYYEGKIGLGILYTFTYGLFFVGWICDLVSIIRKPNPYYVYRK